jgi:putative ABC transport system permease protein
MQQDVRTVVRLVTRHPGFCGAVVLTLGIALGAFTAIFSLVYALILEPLPFREADRLVVIQPVVNAEAGKLTLREYQDLSRETRMFEEWAAYYRSQYNVTGGGAPEALTCTISSSTLFTSLGVRPVLGELWPREQDFTRQYLVLLSHRVWQQRFGGRPDVVGSSIVMDGGTYRVTGVLPAGFDYPLQTDVFRDATDYNAPHVRRYSAIARLRPGVTMAQAQTELDAFATRFAAAYPDTNAGVRLAALPLRDAYVGRARPFLWLMLGAVMLLLVIACVNVTNLLLSRALSASGDAAVRLAIGAWRRHLIRQSMVEALLLASVGAALGGVGAEWALRLMTTRVQGDLPPWFQPQVNPVVWLAAAGAALLTAAVVGLLPALEASRTNVEQVLRQETGRSAGSRRQQAIRRALIAGQVGFATLLLVAAGVFVGGVRELMRTDTGFDAHNVLTFRVDPPYGRYPDIATTSAFYRRAAESLMAQPGIVAAGTNNTIPFSRLDQASPRVVVEGQANTEDAPFVNFQVVDAGYFDAMRIPLRSGRSFDRTDTEASTQVALVSARAARRFWPFADPIGRRVHVVWSQEGTGGGRGSDVPLTIVGVVGDVRYSGIDDTTGLDLYAPNTQLFAGDSYFVVRTRTSPAAVAAQLRAAIDLVDRDQSFFDVQSMQARVEGALWQHRVATIVLAVFGAIALCLAVIGTYAVTAHAVASHGREMGIRLALGSPPLGVAWLMMRRWLVPVGVGLLAGLAAGVAVARALAQLIGLTEWPDLLTPATLPLVLALSTLVACAVPVWRVLRRVQLTDTLRETA